MVFSLAEILGTEQFLGANYLSVLFGGPLGGRKRLFQVRFRIGRTGRLYKGDVDRFGVCGAHVVLPISIIGSYVSGQSQNLQWEMGVEPLNRGGITAERDRRRCGARQEARAMARGELAGSRITVPSLPTCGMADGGTAWPNN